MRSTSPCSSQPQTAERPSCLPSRPVGSGSSARSGSRPSRPVGSGSSGWKGEPGPETRRSGRAAAKEKRSHQSKAHQASIPRPESRSTAHPPEPWISGNGDATSCRIEHRSGRRRDDPSDRESERRRVRRRRNARRGCSAAQSLARGGSGVDRRRDRGERKVAEAARDRTIFETFHEVGQAAGGVPTSRTSGTAGWKRAKPPDTFHHAALAARRKSTPHSSDA